MQSESYGLLAVDKQGNRVLFLNPETFAVERELNAFPPRPHELLMLAPGVKPMYPFLATAFMVITRIRVTKWRLSIYSVGRSAALSICRRCGHPTAGSWAAMAKSISAVSRVPQWR